MNYKKKVESNIFRRIQNQHQINHTGKELIRIDQTTSPLKRPRRELTNGKTKKQSRHILRIKHSNSEDRYTNRNAELFPFLP